MWFYGRLTKLQLEHVVLMEGLRVIMREVVFMVGLQDYNERCGFNGRLTRL
jgi:hypothetical protein